MSLFRMLSVALLPALLMACAGDASVDEALEDIDSPEALSTTEPQSQDEGSDEDEPTTGDEGDGEQTDTTGEGEEPAEAYVLGWCGRGASGFRVLFISVTAVTAVIFLHAW